MIEIKSLTSGDLIRAVDADTLSGADLREANLRGADLRWAKMTADQIATLVMSLGVEVMP
jgi:uncharacterized protein YjbI with pentapeptide repeats